MELMDINYNEQERYYLAKKRVNDIKGFYGNLISYIIFNGFFLILNLYPLVPFFSVFIFF